MLNEHDLQTENGAVFYMQSSAWNRERDTLFFLHGLTADHRMFEGQIAFFREKYNILVWDAPAHGRSRPFLKFNLQDVSEYLNAILDKAGAKEVILVGQSLGGYISQAFLKRHPERVKAFISIDSTPYGEAYYSGFDKWILKQIERMAKLYPFEALKRAMARQVSATPAAYGNMMEMLRPYGKSELCRLMGIGYTAFLEDNCDLEIPCPVLLILGERDRTGKVPHYNKMWAEQTGYPCAVIKGAAHNANVDNPQAVNEAIQAFLEAIAPG